MLQGAMASSERIFTLLDTPVRHRDARRRRVATASGPAGARRDRVPQRLVRVPAQGDANGEPWDWVLRDVSFRAAPGERVAIVGHTGAGKTTLISLLMRFYEPQRGEILFDGVPIRGRSARELRSRIGLVLQDVFLFSRSVDYNIRLGRDRTFRGSACARPPSASAPHRFIERLPRRLRRAARRARHVALGRASASCSPSRARSLSIRSCWCWTKPPAPSIRALEEHIEHAVDDADAAGARRSSSRTGCRPSRTPTASWCCTTASCASRAPTRSCSASGGLYARLYELQFVIRRRLAADRAARLRMRQTPKCRQDRSFHQGAQFCPTREKGAFAPDLATLYSGWTSGRSRPFSVVGAKPEPSGWIIAVIALPIAGVVWWRWSAPKALLRSEAQ